jgi:FkbM family methyltransferase
MNEPWLDEFREAATNGRARVMFDIGANAGDWSDWGRHSFASVIALDCDKRAFKSLRQRFDKTSNVEVVYSAVSDEPGTATVYCRPSAGQTSLLEEHPIGGAGQAEAPVKSIEFVEAVTLDYLAAKYGEPDFIKVDVEGAEAMVLAGATAACFRRCRWLIEVHNLGPAVGRHLERLGYRDCRIMRHPFPDAHPQHYWAYLEPGDET